MWSARPMRQREEQCREVDDQASIQPTSVVPSAIRSGIRAKVTCRYQTRMMQIWIPVSRTTRGTNGVLACHDKLHIYYVDFFQVSTYDHRTLKTRLPVRSALFKQRTGRLVVRWVTTSEYLLLYVFVFARSAFSKVVTPL